MTGVGQSGRVAVFVDEPAEHVGSFDVPKLFDPRGHGFCRRDGTSRSMPRCGRVVL
jgi:hypothetical protein